MATLELCTENKIRIGRFAGLTNHEAGLVKSYVESLLAKKKNRKASKKTKRGS